MDLPNYSSAFKTGSEAWKSGFSPSAPSISKPSQSFPDYTGAFDPSKDSTFSNIWKTGFGPDRDEIFSSLFEKTKDTDKYRKWAGGQSDYKPKSEPFGIPGKAGQVLDNLAAVYPQQTVLPGTPGSPGIGGALGTLAGIGASFIPGLGPGIAAAMPAIGGTIGGLFG